MTSVTVSREDLHREVWETPMSKLAIRYGLSGNGLAKICARMKIPCPPRGFWARKAAGQNVATLPLPPVGSETSSKVEITATPARKEPPAPVPEVLDQVARIRESIAARAGAPRHRFHPVIAGWVRERDERIRQYRRERQPYGPPPQPFTDTEKRKNELLSDLLNIIERAGGKVSDKLGGNIECIMNGEPILVQMREKSRQVRVRLAGSSGREMGSQKTELRPTGFLVFMIKTRLPGGLRQEWVEKAGTSMQEMVPEIAAALISAGGLLVQERRERQERERIQREEERRRYEEQQRRKTDRNRWRRFLEFASRHREAEKARTFLASLERQGRPDDATIDGKPLAEWIQWVKNWIEAYDTANRSSEELFEDISRIQSWTYNDE